LTAPPTNNNIFSGNLQFICTILCVC